MDSAPIWRPSARLIVRDPSDRILLFSLTESGQTGWFTPGGGVRRGETLEAAAVRELAEETGHLIAEADVGPVVATRGGLWRAEGSKVFFGADSFFWVRVADATVSTDDREELERSVITGHRWWTAAELLGITDRITPGLPELVNQLLTSGVPRSPVRLPWRAIPVRNA
jgi:8-oxo-dGTP pyrophosphatase MutT (NUDIX family)